MHQVLYVKLTWLILLTPTWNASFKNSQRNIFIKNLLGTENRYISGTQSNA